MIEILGSEGGDTTFDVGLVRIDAAQLSLACSALDALLAVTPEDRARLDSLRERFADVFAPSALQAMGVRGRATGQPLGVRMSVGSLNRSMRRAEQLGCEQVRVLVSPGWLALDLELGVDTLAVQQSTDRPNPDKSAVNVRQEYGEQLRITRLLPDELADLTGSSLPALTALEGGWRRMSGAALDPVRVGSMLDRIRYA